MADRTWLVVAPMSLRMATFALAPRAGFAPHALASLVAAVSKQLGVAGDLSAGDRHELRPEVTEIVACPHHQPEHVAMDFRDPVTRYLIRSDDQDGLAVGFGVRYPLGAPAISTALDAEFGREAAMATAAALGCLRRAGPRTRRAAC
jgi:hypothetical protein